MIGNRIYYIDYVYEKEYLCDSLNIGIGCKEFEIRGLFLRNGWLYLGTMSDHCYYVNCCGRVIKFQNKSVECLIHNGVEMTLLHNDFNHDEIYSLDDEGNIIERYPIEDYKKIIENMRETRKRIMAEKNEDNQ